MKLKPCLFCGGEAIVVRNVFDGSDAYHIECTRCLAEHARYMGSREAAIEAWNTRAERTCENGMPRSYNYLECSLCGSLAYKGSAEFRYCPNCGAKVVE